MTPSHLARVLFVGGAVTLAAASTSSSSNQPNQNGSMIQPYGQSQGGGPPAPQQMEPGRVLGLWNTNFGAVKLEADNSKGGIASGAVQGVWVYQRHGQEVIGYFAGNLRGNVMQFRWQEPGAQGGPPLNGEGWLQFDTAGRQYSGRWWTDRRDRVGDWNGWRQAGGGSEPSYDPQQPGAYGGQSYGGQQGPSYAPPPSSGPSQPPPPSDRRYY
jgi:hypothetical protein